MDPKPKADSLFVLPPCWPLPRGLFPSSLSLSQILRFQKFGPVNPLTNGPPFPVVFTRESQLPPSRKWLFDTFPKILLFALSTVLSDGPYPWTPPFPWVGVASLLPSFPPFWRGCPTPRGILSMGGTLCPTLPGLFGGSIASSGASCSLDSWAAP